MTGKPHWVLFMLVALWMLASGPGRAQQYSFQAFDRKAGLESQTINCMLQDWRGFVWACSEMGLYRFDGSNFQRMGRAQGFVRGEYVTAIAQDAARQRIWVATQSGLRVGDGLNFKHVEPEHKPLVADVGRKLAVLEDGRLLLVRDGRLLALTMQADHPWRLQPMFDADRMARHPELSNVTSVFLDRGSLWLGCDGALCELDRAGKLHLYGPQQGIPSDTWLGFLRDRQGTLWVRGVHRVVVRSGRAAHFVARDVPDSAMDVVTDDGGFVEDASGRVLTRTNHGLARWDGAGWSTIDASNGLPEIGVIALLFDRDGALWLGTYGRGIYRWNGYGLIEGWGIAQGLDSVPNWSILRDDQERLWLGNELGGSVLAPQRNRLQPWPLAIEPAPRQVLSLAKAADGAIWVGLYDRRVLRYDPVSNRTSLAATLPVFIKTLYLDRRGRLWIGTVNGIYRIDAVGAPAQQMPANLSTDKQCSDITEDAQGGLWFACNSGVLRYTNEQWVRMRTPGVPMASGYSTIASDRDGSLWLGGNEPGVFRARVSGDLLQAVHIGDAWLDNSLAYFIRRDRRGLIWIGGGGGVDVYDGARWTHIAKDDGLLWDETDQNAFFEDADGSVWIGSAIGVSHILKPLAMLAPSARAVMITSVRYGTEPVEKGASVHVTDHGAPLTVRYALLGRSSGSAAHFRYRLRGSDWIETSAHVLNFTGLSSGDYRFEIQAIDDDRRMLSEIARFDFQIAPPWWLAWWTYPLELLALVIIVGLSWRWHSRRLLRQNKRLEAMVSQRTAELTEEKRELERARAELYDQATHDALTGLYNRKAILDLLAAQLNLAVRVPPGLAVALIDADHFKRINDTFGHQAGDATLQAITRHLEAYVREGDQLGRYGGEEILMVLPGIGRIDAENRMQQIQAAVSATPHSWQGDQYRVTLSIGLLWIGREEVSVEDVIRRADFALYEAKSGGRDRVVSEVPA
jgi:diguanylate cyclase (GGDEF)-like protein